MIIGLFIIGVALIYFGLRMTSLSLPIAIGAVITVSVTISVVASVWAQGEDLGMIRAQHYVIEVQQKRVDTLMATIKSVHPDLIPGDIVGSTALMNADTPTKSLVEALATANTDLAEAGKKEAEAKVSLASRIAGPWWFVVKIYGTT